MNARHVAMQREPDSRNGSTRKIETGALPSGQGRRPNSPSDPGPSGYAAPDHCDSADRLAIERGENEGLWIRDSRERSFSTRMTGESRGLAGR